MSPALCGVMVRLGGLRSSLRGLQFRSGSEGVTLAGKPCKYDTIQFIAKTCTSHICKSLSMLGAAHAIAYRPPILWIPTHNLEEDPIMSRLSVSQALGSFPSAPFHDLGRSHLGKALEMSDSWTGEDQDTSPTSPHLERFRTWRPDWMLAVLCSMRPLGPSLPCWPC